MASPSLAGLYYRYENIPDKWLEAIVKREEIEGLCDRLCATLKENNV